MLLGLSTAIRGVTFTKQIHPCHTQSKASTWISWIGNDPLSQILLMSSWPFVLLHLLTSGQLIQSSSSSRLPSPGRETPLNLSRLHFPSWAIGNLNNPPTLFMLAWYSRANLGRIIAEGALRCSIRVMNLKYLSCMLPIILSLSWSYWNTAILMGVQLPNLLLLPLPACSIRPSLSISPSHRSSSDSITTPTWPCFWAVGWTKSARIRCSFGSCLWVSWVELLWSSSWSVSWDSALGWHLISLAMKRSGCTSWEDSSRKIVRRSRKAIDRCLKGRCLWKKIGKWIRTYSLKLSQGMVMRWWGKVVWDLWRKIYYGMMPLGDKSIKFCQSPGTIGFSEPIRIISLVPSTKCPSSKRNHNWENQPIKTNLVHSFPSFLLYKFCNSVIHSFHISHRVMCQTNNLTTNYSFK